MELNCRDYVLEKQLMGMFAHHCWSNFSLLQGSPLSDFSAFLLILLPFMVFDSFLLSVYILIIES